MVKSYPMERRHASAEEGVTPSIFSIFPGDIFHPDTDDIFLTQDIFLTKDQSFLKI